MAISDIRQTHTYATLAVSESCFRELEKRIIVAGPDYADRYIDNRDPDNCVIHWGGEIGLIVDKEQGDGTGQA